MWHDTRLSARHKTDGWGLFATEHSPSFNPMELSPLHERILAVIGDRTYRSIGQVTEHNAETVRRYLQGQAPSVEFLVALCTRFDVNAHWLITGHGAMKYSETMAEALRSANPAELLSAVADALERLTDRVDRLEVFVQTLDVRVRRVGPGSDGTTPKAPNGDQQARQEPTCRGGLLPEGGHPRPPARTSAPGGAHQRARRIADAVTERPPQDAS